MKCDACSSNIEYDETYIYKTPEDIKYCLDCASKYIKDNQIKQDLNKEWKISVYNK